MMQLGLLFVFFQRNSTMTNEGNNVFECCILCHGTTDLVLVLADIQSDSERDKSIIIDHPPTLQ